MSALSVRERNSVLFIIDMQQYQPTAIDGAGAIIGPAIRISDPP